MNWNTLLTTSFYGKIIVIIFLALGALIALTLLIALLIPLGVWKLWARRQDKLNWKKFEKQQGETTWIEEQNPLFKSAETTVVNPMYTGN